MVGWENLRPSAKHSNK